MLRSGNKSGNKSGNRQLKGNLGNFKPDIDSQNKSENQ